MMDESVRSGLAHPIVEHLLVQETAILRYALLAHQTVGRIIFTAIILVAYINGPAPGHQTPLVVFSAVLGAVWLASGVAISSRTRTVLRLITETAYFDDSRWGSTYVRVYLDRYQGPWHLVLSRVMIFEPALWAGLTIWAVL